MTKTILCAVDINRPKEDRKVLERAAQLAVLDKAQLDVITVVPDFGANIVGAYLQDHHVETAQDKAKQLLNDLSEAALGAEVNAKTRHIVAVGSVYEKVLETARLGKADLIVIGAHRQDFKDYLLGPNAARIVRHSDASVYVVR
ncbi:universal stress protein [Aliiroseovarius crassostreae]|uniref:universal stress protein n=1 Tax=Aliiroseovarius crassostreae TaxID=154981 RepID=UPI003C7EBB1B